LRSRLLIIVLAAVLALAGTVAVLAYARNANQRAIAGLKTVNVIAAKGIISPRTSLAEAKRAGLLISETLPESSVPTQALRSTVGLAAGLVFSSTVQPAQLILRPMLVPATQFTANSVLPLSGTMEAVTILMCEQEVVPGYLAGGSYVTVYATVPEPGAVLERTCETTHQALLPSATRTIPLLERVQVLSVASRQPTTLNTPSGGSVVVDPVNSLASSLTQGTVLVTFAVTQAEAIKLIGYSQTDLPYLGLLPSTTKP
jgi:pilus assembly protein CpaB